MDLGTASFLKRLYMSTAPISQVLSATRDFRNATYEDNGRFCRRNHFSPSTGIPKGDTVSSTRMGTTGNVNSDFAINCIGERYQLCQYMTYARNNSDLLPLLPSRGASALTASTHTAPFPLIMPLENATTHRVWFLSTDPLRPTTYKRSTMRC